MTAESSVPRVNSSLSVISLHVTALEVCYSVYGEPSFDAIERFYEADAIYENPFLTASSRSVIADIFKLSRQLSAVDVPKPLAVLYTLFRLKIPQHLNNPLFRALRVWTDIGDISETESFDGNKKIIVEHNLNMLLLPGLHVDCNTHVRFQPQEPRSPLESHHPTFPSLPVPGTSLSVPSPFHFRLHVITRLSFNELGKVTHHRDFWDIKDVMGLVPGASLAQWVGTRLAARSLTYAVRFWSQEPVQSAEHALPAPDVEKGVTPAQAYVASAKATFGLDG